MVNLRLPHINGANEREQLKQTQRYLYQLVEQLQFALNTLEASINSSTPAKSTMPVRIIQPSPVATMNLDMGGDRTISDTGWISLGLTDEVSASTINAGRSGNGCFYRVINGNHVYVAFNCSFAYANSPITISAAQIPAPYKPSRNIYALSTTNGRGIARSFVNSSGDVCIDYVQNMASGENTTAVNVNWIDGYIDYWV